MEGSRMVVGVDFSEGSAAAVAEARRLAAGLQCDVELVHVTRYTSEWQPDAEATAWLEQHDLDECSLVVRIGLPWVELARHARETRPAMIVVGSHGGSGFHPLGLGSTPARLGVVSPVPVLVVAPQSTRRAGQPANGGV